MTDDNNDWAFATRAVRAGQHRTNEGEHSEPIFATSSYVFKKRRRGRGAFCRDGARQHLLAFHQSHGARSSRSAWRRWKAASVASPSPPAWSRSFPPVWRC